MRPEGRRKVKTIRGRFDGNVVILEEPAPVQGEVEVVITFPETEDSAPRVGDPLRAYWDNAASVRARFNGTASDEVLRQRGRFDVTPSGLPEHLPSEAEWKERAARASRLIRQWQIEGSSEDVATSEELKAGIESNPIQFREADIGE